jgi:threonine dehydrogenase-like Zn-dependent dehydrogenase
MPDKYPSASQGVTASPNFVFRAGDIALLATIMYAAGDVRVENVPDAVLTEPTDAVVRVTRACICGSDLWPYRSMERSEAGQSMGHEAIGIVEAVGSAVSKVKPGDFMIMPFAYFDGRCELSLSCPPGVKHWHGAAPNTAMTHLAVTGNQDGTNVNWMEKVSDEQYNAR